jgi:hypothetical protein
VRSLTASRSALIRHADCATGLERYDDVDDPLFLDYYNVDPVDVMSEASLQALEEAKQSSLPGRRPLSSLS